MRRVLPVAIVGFSVWTASCTLITDVDRSKIGVNGDYGGNADASTGDSGMPTDTTDVDISPGPQDSGADGAVDSTADGATPDSGDGSTPNDGAPPDTTAPDAAGPNVEPDAAGPGDLLDATAAQPDATSTPVQDTGTGEPLDSSAATETTASLDSGAAPDATVDSGAAGDAGDSSL